MRGRMLPYCSMYDAHSTTVTPGNSSKDRSTGPVAQIRGHPGGRAILPKNDVCKGHVRMIKHHSIRHTRQYHRCRLHGTVSGTCLTVIQPHRDLTAERCTHPPPGCRTPSSTAPAGSANLQAEPCVHRSPRTQDTLLLCLPLPRGTTHPDTCLEPCVGTRVPGTCL